MSEDAEKGSAEAEIDSMNLETTEDHDQGGVEYEYIEAEPTAKGGTGEGDKVEDEEGRGGGEEGVADIEEWAGREDEVSKEQRKSGEAEEDKERKRESQRPSLAEATKAEAMEDEVVGAMEAAEAATSSKRVTMDETVIVTVVEAERRPAAGEETDELMKLLTEEIGGPGLKKGDKLKVLEEHKEDEVTDEAREYKYRWEGPCSSTSSSSSSSFEDAQMTREMEKRRDASREQRRQWLLQSARRAAREAKCREYRDLVAEGPRLRKKNIILQKRVYDFCKIRKLQAYFEESEATEEDPRLAAAFARELEQLSAQLAEGERARAQRGEEERALREQVEGAERGIEAALRGLEEAQRRVAPAMLFVRAGRPFSEKNLEELLRRQQEVVEQLHEHRVTHTQLRNSLARTEKEIQHLDTHTFGGGMRLLDYEQLRLENQTNSDRIEEREEELTRLRIKATSRIQTMAHVREMASATADAVEELYDDLETYDKETENFREILNTMKQKRERLRAECQELRVSAGMLVQRNLLRDFKGAARRTEQLDDEIHQLKEQYEKSHQQLQGLTGALTQDETTEEREAARDERRRTIADNYEVYKGMLARKRSTIFERRETLRRATLVYQSTVEEIKRGGPHFFGQASLKY